MENGHNKNGGPLEHKSTTKTDKGLQMRFSYSPTLAHAERFADLTGDDNPIHRELFGGETVAPAFLQNVAAMIASRKAISQHGLNPLDLPCSHNRVSLEGFVVTGLDYEFLVTLKDNPLEIDVKITDPRGNGVFGINRTFEGVSPPNDYGESIYISSFDVNGRALSEFGKIVGVASSESNLYCMASSSAAILKAYYAGALPEMEDGIVPIYSGQEIYVDVGKSRMEGVEVKLSVPEIPKDKLKKGDRLKTMVSSWHKGNLIGRIASEIAFESKKLPKVAVRKALKSRKSVA